MLAKVASASPLDATPVSHPWTLLWTLGVTIQGIDSSMAHSGGRHETGCKVLSDASGLYSFLCVLPSWQPWHNPALANQLECEVVYKYAHIAED